MLAMLAILIVLSFSWMVVLPVFDEAHNIDSVCIEAYSININRKKLDRASANLTKLKKRVSEVKQKDKERLEKEYRSLVRVLK